MWFLMAIEMFLTVIDMLFAWQFNVVFESNSMWFLMVIDMLFDGNQHAIEWQFDVAFTGQIDIVFDNN